MTDRELVAIRKPQRGIHRGERPHLRDLTRDELAAWYEAEMEGPRYRVDQLYGWIHQHGVTSFDAMTNLGKVERGRLAERADVSGLAVDLVQRSVDGTRKLRQRTADGQAIETVLIPNEGRGYTQCISSMVGCSLTCRFCATASLGFVRNLSTWEIVDQVYRARALLEDEAQTEARQWPERITNLVFMGMGEPLHNYGQVTRAIQILTDPEGVGIAGRRVTVSTAGLVPAIERFAREGLGNEVGLAVSLNATTDATRDQVMPINTRWDISTLLDAVRHCPTPRRRLVTFEYVLLGDVNDTDADAGRLAGLLADLDCQVNVIPFNPHPHAPYRRPTPERIHAFVEGLRRRGVRVHVRTPRGDDIDAACGQLAAEDRPPAP